MMLLTPLGEPMMRILTDSRFEVGSGEADGETGTAGVSLAFGINSSDIGVHLILDCGIV
jgi:hypothetical protein